MPTTPYLPPPPTTQGSNLSPTDYQWMLIVQGLRPLNLIDSSKGPVTIPLPAAGIASSGQTAQGKELIFKKTSADSNLITITGAAEGPQTFSMQYAGMRFQSDGTEWWVVGSFM